ncbi:MAG: DUF3987 domain-containing protein [Rhodobacteraceae bacterium]|nr:DUF3987 domain-containing protein [Paracoccaceae bacterium]MCF8515262.1 DUF3987 domain-containing protein [Paracoccaceae bacterium]MCF8519554.1 DUF3987 domain-containing protein [Paracoccaceae bacterium]
MTIHPTETPFTGEGPQPLLRPILPGADYPKAALGPLCEAVEAVQGMTLAPFAVPAQSALAVASLAVQGFANVETLGGGFAPPSLYALTIARSGERKSSCDGPLMAALRAYEREQAVAQRDALTQWRNAQSLWKGERDRILAEAKNGKGEKRVAAQVDLDRLGPEPLAPPSADRTVTEPTFEGLTKLFAEGQPSLGIFADEGGQFIGGHAMNSDNRLKTLTALNDLWQGNPIRRTRAGDGAFTLFGRRLAVHLMIQPEVARGLLADSTASGTGFLPRFLMTEPPSTIGTRLSSLTRRDDAALGRFSDRLRTILETPMAMDPDTRELHPRDLCLAPDARALLVAFADTIEQEQGAGGSLTHVTGYASKAAEQAVRIAAVLTLWGDLMAPAVTVQAMASGIMLAQYYLGEAVRLSDAALISVDTAQAEALRLWLLDRWPEQAQRMDRDPATVTPKDAMQYGPNALREAKVARKLMGTLADSGWLVALAEGEVIGGVARKLAYRIVRPRDVV